jgi:AcrR family transcriptional regulator
MKSVGLREEQKASRRQSILEIARVKFESEKYADVTIEAIAAEAKLSPVTVYNYFGNKAGLLLALVSESDELLIAQLEAMIREDPGNLIESVARFGQILRQHAMSYLSKQTWREVLAASIQFGSQDFGRSYAELDQVLIELMGSLIENLQSNGFLAKNIDRAALANTLFSLQNIRFFQFIADDNISNEMIDRTFRADLAGLAKAFGAPT